MAWRDLLPTTRRAAARDLERRGIEWGSSAIPTPTQGMGGGTYASVDLRRNETALQMAAIWASVNLICRLVGSLPLDTYLRQQDGALPRNIPNGKLVTDPGGDGYGRADWIAQLLMSALTSGNVYGKPLSPDRTGRPTQIVLFHPDTVIGWRDTDTGMPQWRVNGVEVRNADMWHKRVYPTAGRLLGLSPIQHHMVTIGQGMAAGRFGKQFFDDGGHPTGILRNTQVQMNPTLIARAKALWMAIMHGSREPLVMGKGWEYQQVQINPEESQFLATQGYTAAECARIYGPGMPEILGYESGGGLTYANISQRMLHLLVLTLDPWLTWLEDIFTALLPQPQFVKFNRGALLRMNTADRYAAYAIASSIGLQTPNEQRALEDMGPVPWGDKPWVAAQQAPPPAEPDGDEQQRGQSARSFNPSEPRDPLTGKWGIGGSGGSVKDALRLADRIQLGKGETFAGSGKVRDKNGDMTAVLAAVDTPSGRTVRLGLVQPEHERSWRAANKGGTVELDKHGAAQLRETLSGAAEAGRDSVKQYYADVRKAHAAKLPDNEWPDPEAEIASGTIRAGWGNLHWTLQRDADTGPEIPGIDAPGAGWSLGLQVVPNSGAVQGTDPLYLDTAAKTKALEQLIAELADAGSAVRHQQSLDRAQKHDIAEEGHDYWVHGKGLAKWADTDDPWTELHTHLVKFMPDGEAKRTATEWFHEVFHFYPGSDLNRVTHGQPPRGKKVGPG